METVELTASEVAVLSRYLLVDIDDLPNDVRSVLDTLLHLLRDSMTTDENNRDSVSDLLNPGEMLLAVNQDINALSRRISDVGQQSAFKSDVANLEDRVSSLENQSNTSAFETRIRVLEGKVDTYLSIE